VVDVCSFSTIEDGRSVYQKGRQLEWWVDSEKYSIIDMENDVAEHFHWSINQEANFWFEDQNGQTSRLATDQQLIALLRASKLVKFIMTIDRCEHGQNMTQMEDQSLVINDDGQFEGNEQQLVVSNAEDLVQVSSRDVISSCGQWQISGKPCTHAISFIGSLRRVKLEDYVHDYYSLERFKSTYQFVVNPMVDKSEWRVGNPGFEMLPPKIERSGGRPRVKRIKSRGEPGKRGSYQCKSCFQFGHIEKGCREPPTELGAELPPSLPAKSK